MAEFTRAMLKDIQADMVEAVQSVAKKYGLEIVAAGGSYEALEFKPKFKVTFAGGETKEARDFKEFGKIYDLKPEWLGAMVPCRGGMAKVIGLNLNAKTYPVTVERGGKRFAMKAEAVVRFLDSRKAA